MRKKIVTLTLAMMLSTAMPAAKIQRKLAIIDGRENRVQDCRHRWVGKSRLCLVKEETKD